MIESYSPTHPDDLVASVAEASAADVAAAAERARTAQADWAGSAAGRAQALTAAAEAVAGAGDELAGLMVREVGKPIGEARGEVARSVAILRYYAEQVFDPVGEIHEPSGSGPSGSALLFHRRRPVGVAGLITPWNFPAAIPLWKAAPAWAFGNAVLLKPAPEATGMALRLAELFAPVLPEGLFAVLPGDAETGQAVVSVADVVSFTGSGVAGRAVNRAAADRGIAAQAEMGGQNPAIVLPDADVETAAKNIAAAAFGFAGQKCTATKRVVVVGDNPSFTDALVAAAEAMQVGDPATEGVTVGPVIDERARDRVHDVAQDAIAAGGKLLTGGGTPPGKGWFIQPTLVEGVAGDHTLACDEVFGPIALVQHAPDLDAAIAMANNVEHGLAAAIYTTDLPAALAATDRLEAGLVKVNAPTSGVDFYLPFGGDKASSIGLREQGKAAAAFYTTTHTVTISG